MAKKLFWKNQMASEDVNSLLISGRFYNDEDAVAEVHDGAIVVVGDLEDHALYAGVKDLNVRKITAPEAATDAIAIVDVVNVSEGAINGVVYREGIKTTDMKQQAGVPVRVRVFKKYDSFNIGAGNIDGTPVVGEYLIPVAGSTLLAPSAEKVEGTTCFKVEAKLNLTEGVIDTDYKYLCTAVSVVE
jgi:hypothetical protein